MEPKIKRKFRSFTIALTTSTVTAVPIRFDDVAGGNVVLSAGAAAATSLAVWSGSDATTNASFGRLYKDGSAISIALSQSSTEARTYPFPDESYGSGAVKLVADNAAVTGVTCTVMLKG
jgi:hypothetical protein